MEDLFGGHHGGSYSVLILLLFGGLLTLLLKPDARIAWAVRMAMAAGTLGIAWLAWHLAMGHADDATNMGGNPNVDLAVLVIALAVALLGFVLATNRR